MLRQGTLLVFIATMFACTSVCAQYAWVDEKGVKQFSDTPPPSSVPKNRILKSKNQADNAGDNTNTVATQSSEASTPKQNTTESRNEDYNKRRAEQAEKDKKAADSQQAANEKSKNCERIKSYLKTLESGTRIANTDSNGERAFMNDDQRAKELADAKKASMACQ